MNKLVSVLVILPAMAASCDVQSRSQSRQPLFSASTSVRIAVGTGPGSIAIADLNGDANSDLMVVNEGSNNVTILLGDGKGKFAQAAGSPFPAGNSPNDIAIGDVNGDGKLDLAFPNHETKHVTLLLGDGRGRFAPAPNSPLTIKSDPHPHTIAIGDLNGDHKPDLVVDDWENSNLTILLGKGDGNFATPGTSLAVPPIPYQNTRLADVNDDGRLDIITLARRRNAVTVLLGDGKGSFKQSSGSPFPAGASPFFVAIGDVNGDRKPDLAIANYSGSISDPRNDGATILLGDGAGVFKPAAGSPFRAGRAPVRAAIGDVNGDGIDDVAVVSLGSNDVTVLLGGKKGITVAPGSPFAVGQEPYAAAIGDLNSDGRPDLVTANHSSNDVTILFGEKGEPIRSQRQR